MLQNLYLYNKYFKFTLKYYNLYDNKKCNKQVAKAFLDEARNFGLFLADWELEMLMSHDLSKLGKN